MKLCGWILIGVGATFVGFCDESACADASRAVAVAPTHWELVMAEPVSEVVSTSQGLVANPPGALIWLRPDGSVLARRLAAPAMATPQRTSAATGDEALLEQQGLDPALRDTDEGELWLDDMRSLRDKRGVQRAPEQPQIIASLASNGEAMFAASGHQVFRLPQPGELRSVMRLPIAPHRLAVSRRGRLAVASAGALYVVDPASSMASAHACTPLSGVPDELAALDVSSTAAGSCHLLDLVWRHGNTAFFRAARTGTTHSLPWDVVSLQGCGSFALIDTRHGLFLMAPGRSPHEPYTAVQVAAMAPHPHLACSGAYPDTLAAFSTDGAGASASYDGGKTWSSLHSPAGMRISSVAVSDECIWVATPGGLWRLHHDGAQPSHDLPRASPVLSSRPPRVSWGGWMPSIWIDTSLSQATAENGVRTNGMAALLTAEFPLVPRRYAAYDLAVAETLADRDAGTSSPKTGAKPSTAAARASEIAVRPLAQPWDSPSRPPPCLEQLRAEATRLAGADPERLRSLITRARHAAWLPELRFRLEKRLGRNQSLDLDREALAPPLGLRTIDDVRLEVRATWDLARTVYSPDELAATVQSSRLAEARREVAALVNRLFFERRRQDEAERAAQRAMQSEVAHPGHEATALEDTGHGKRNEAFPADQPGASSPSPSPTTGQGGRRRSDNNGTSHNRTGDPAFDLEALRAAEISADLEALTGGLAATCR